MTNRTATTAPIILSLAAAGAPAASARLADYVPTSHQPPASVYDRPDNSMIPVAAPYSGDAAPATVPQAIVGVPTREKRL